VVLAQETGAPFKVAWRAMEREGDAGHVECGMWLHGGWLTDKGKAELQRLRDAQHPSSGRDEGETVG
jgi:hypothetical protein